MKGEVCVPLVCIHIPEIGFYVSSMINTIEQNKITSLFLLFQVTWRTTSQPLSQGCGTITLRVVLWTVIQTSIPAMVTALMPMLAMVMLDGGWSTYSLSTSSTVSLSITGMTNVSGKILSQGLP